MTTKVKIVKITSLKSYQLLKEAEGILMEAEHSSKLSANSKNVLACITLNNLGCFYKKL